jgi:phospho-N-acetylmuramoyl-pentapeptide-transferase
MLYELFYWLLGERDYAYNEPLFRGAMAVLLAFLIVWMLGPRTIHLLLRLKIGDQAQFNHKDLNELTKVKRNTPTMGGVLIMFAVLVATLMLGDLRNAYIGMGLICLVWLTVLGGVDDYLKLTGSAQGGTRDGLRMWEKLVFQLGLGALLALSIYQYGMGAAREDQFLDIDKAFAPFNVLSVPFYKGTAPYYGIVLSFPIFWLITMIVVAGTSNAVNLTDGMDGLACGCMVLTALVFMRWLAWLVM